MNMTLGAKTITIDSSSVSINATLSATLIGFSAAIITIIATPTNRLEDFPNIKYILIFYVLAIIFYIFSIDSITVAIWDTKNYEMWENILRIAYGLGMGWFIIGISLTFDILVKLPQIANLTLTLFLLMYLIHWGIRWRFQSEEIKNEMLVARAVMVLQIFLGYVLIYALD